MDMHDISTSLVAGFRQQFHYKAMARGDNEQANCVDCHTAHNTRPKEDPLATINENNLVKTCGGDGANGCHPNANAAFAGTAFHMPIHERDDLVVIGVDRAFTYLTVGTMAVLILHILLSLYGEYVAQPRRARQQTA